MGSRAVSGWLLAWLSLTAQEIGVHELDDFFSSGEHGTVHRR
jgi:hypothetical protein